MWQYAEVEKMVAGSSWHIPAEAHATDHPASPFKAIVISIEYRPLKVVALGQNDWFGTDPPGPCN